MNQASQRPLPCPLVETHVLKLPLRYRISKTLGLKERHRKRRIVPPRVCIHLPDKRNLTQAALSPRGPYSRVLHGQLSQTTAEDDVRLMMRDNSLSQPRITGVFTQQSTQSGQLIAPPAIVDLNEDIQLVLEPTIESLWRESGTPRNPVGVGSTEPMLVEFSGSGFQ
jgi:hypothetical protein